MASALFKIGAGVFLAYGISDKSFQAFKKHSLDPFNQTRTKQNHEIEAFLYLLKPIPAIAKEIYSSNEAFAGQFTQFVTDLSYWLSKNRKKDKNSADGKAAEKGIEISNQNQNGKVDSKDGKVDSKDGKGDSKDSK